MKQFQNFFLKPYIYIVVILVGVIINFTKLDKTYFWEDEVSTIIHTSGISLSKFYNFFPQNEIKNVSYYYEKLALNNGNYTIKSQISGLMKMPQFTPFHYVLLIFWHRIIGDHYMDYRLFSLMAYLLTLPLLFYLTNKIFKSKQAAWICISLFSISPFFSFFSIEARYYMLWAFIIVALHAAFLKSIEGKGSRWWVIYGFTAAIAMYISLFSSLAIVSHTLYVYLRKKDKWLPLTMTQATVVLAYMPWIIFLYKNYTILINAMAWQKASTWNMEISIWQLLFGQLTSMGKLFLSTTTDSWLVALIGGNYSSAIYLDMILVCVITLAIIASFIYSIRMTTTNYKWLILFLIVPNFLFIFLTDLIRGSFITFLLRYTIVSYIIVFLAVGFAVAKLFEKKKILFFTAYFLLVFGCLYSLSLEYNKPCLAKRDDCTSNRALAEHLASSGKTLLITDFTPNLMNFISVLIASNNDSLDILCSYNNYPDFKNELPLYDYRNLYVVHASQALSDSVKNNLADTKSINWEIIDAGWNWSPDKK